MTNPAIPDAEASQHDELDGLDPLSGTVTLVSGTVVEILPLRARQFFKFLRILTHGAMPMLGDQLKLDPDGDASAFATRLLSLLILSVPDAEDETVIFIRSMVKPLGLIEPARNKQDQERNVATWDALDRELFNPELDDVVTIMENVVQREAGDIQALGKRLASLFKLAQRTGQLKSQRPTSLTSNSSADSPEASTSSPASTGGRKSTSKTSPSGVSANA